MLLYSLIFGILAWILAGYAIKSRKKSIPVISSFLCCSVSAVWQFFEIRKRVNLGDTGGVIDTIDVTIFGIAVMIIITLILNFIALRIQDKSEE